VPSVIDCTIRITSNAGTRGNEDKWNRLAMVYDRCVFKSSYEDKRPVSLPKWKLDPIEQSLTITDLSTTFKIL